MLNWVTKDLNHEILWRQDFGNVFDFLSPKKLEKNKQNETRRDHVPSYKWYMLNLHKVYCLSISADYERINRSYSVYGKADIKRLWQTDPLDSKNELP